jgi:hypothetical protein
MSEASIIALSEFAIKFGLDAAIAWAESFKGGATIDTAIAALQAAKTKTAADYLAEAKAAVTPPPA